MRLVATCVLLALVGVASASVRAASAYEFGRPCSWVGAQAILPQPTYFSATTGAPYTPPKAGFTTEAPLSDLTASAQWGDGSTTPANLASTGCDTVSAESHVYTHSGAYPFSYVVHDASTGIDHTIQAGTAFEHMVEPLTVYIWGAPQRTDPPGAHRVLASVGVPWTGVLGEFSDEPPAEATIGFHAIVEWESEDRTWSHVGVTESPTGTYVITGSHVFAEEFTGTATVHAYAAEATTSWTVPVTVGPRPRLHFARAPILAALRSPSGTSYELVFRLDRHLQSGANGTVAATLSGPGFSATIGDLLAHESTPCYIAQLIPSKGALGPHVRFTIDPQDGVASLSATVRSHRFASAHKLRAQVRSRLGCR
jgi:hypothetical protein